MYVNADACMQSTEGTGPKQEKMKSSWLSFFGVDVDKDKPAVKPAPQV